jgi:hypothetical protein
MGHLVLLQQWTVRDYEEPVTYLGCGDKKYIHNLREEISRRWRDTMKLDPRKIGRALLVVRPRQIIQYTRAVWKVCGLTLLLRVGTLRGCSDGLFFEVPPLASDALLTTLHPFLENDSGTGGFLVSELPFHSWKSPEIAWGEIWTP